VNAEGHVSVDRLKDRIIQVAGRVPAVVGLGEAATKQALIMPLLEGLGYDIWNPGEVRPEFEGDFAVKKAGQKEKADIAILFDGQPRIFIECKPVEVDLDGHEGQLARYFNAVPSVSLGVLTNGQEYRFFTDTAEPNIMDSRPFFVFRPDAVDLRLDVLVRFSRAQFNAEAIRDFATELFHTSTIVQFLRNELDLRGRPPSEHFIRWVLASDRIHEGRVTEKVVDRFRPILSNALQTVLREIVRRSVAALDQGVTEAATPNATATERSEAPPAPSPAPTAAAEADAGADDGRAKIVTTERELEVFDRVKTILANAGISGSTIFDPATRREAPIEVSCKDTSGYFGVFLNKPGWWVVRAFTETRTPWIGFPIDNAEIRASLPEGAQLVVGHAFAPLGVRINGPADLAALRRAVELSALWVIAQRQGTAAS
jgi:hypothetical protein